MLEHRDADSPDVRPRTAEKLRKREIEPDGDFVDRAFAWVRRERFARAERHRPEAIALMDNYERALRASYVTDEDIVERALATAGRFD